MSKVEILNKYWRCPWWNCSRIMQLPETSCADCGSGMEFAEWYDPKLEPKL